MTDLDRLDTLAAALAAAIHEFHEGTIATCRHPGAVIDGEPVNDCDGLARYYLATPSGQSLVARVRAAEAVVEEARLVGQWHDAVDTMPEELRGELRDLWDHARAALATAQGGEQ